MPIYLGEGNGNPLQCSCLENPRDGGAWWAAVYGVAQSRTQLKRLSSSSSIYLQGAMEAEIVYKHLEANYQDAVDCYQYRKRGQTYILQEKTAYFQNYLTIFYILLLYIIPYLYVKIH